MISNYNKTSVDISSRCLFVSLFLLLHIGILYSQPDAKADSGKTTEERKNIYRINPVIVSKQLEQAVCEEPLETGLQCFRGNRGVAVSEDGFSGTHSYLYSLSDYRPIAYTGFYNPVSKTSPYGAGGTLIPKAYKNIYSGGRITGVEEIWNVPSRLDTPSTALNWQRGAFDMNMFHLSHTRLLTVNSYFSFMISSDRVEGVPDYNYVFQVHQPYLSGIAGLNKLIPMLERDSSSLVIQGVMPDIGAMHLRPKAGFFIDSNKVVEIYLDRYKNTSDLISPKDSIISDFDFDEAVQVPIPASFSSLTAGGIAFLNFNYASFLIKAFHASSERNEYSLNPLLFYQNADERNFSTKKYLESINELGMEIAVPNETFNPKLFFIGTSEEISGDMYLRNIIRDSTAFKSAVVRETWADFQNLNLEVSPSWRLFSSRVLAGVTRHSLMDNSEKYLMMYSVNTALKFPLGFGFSAGHGLQTVQPGWQDMYVLNSVFRRYPNPSLSHETIYNYQAGFSYTQKWIDLETDVNLNHIDNSILPSVLPMKDSIKADDSSACRLSNYASEDRHTLDLRIGFNLGNWKLFTENTMLWFNRLNGENLIPNPEKINPTIPSLIYKGGLSWYNRFVNNRLGVGVDWKWEWYSKRYGWAPRMDGTSLSTKLDEYLILDFTARMEIKEFILYYQVKNFNHDRYYLAPGSHPPGVNFRWGVNWRLDG